MTTYLVWILLVANTYGQGAGVTTNIGHFKTKEQCEHVLKNRPGKQYNSSAVCIQAEIVK